LYFAQLPRQLFSRCQVLNRGNSLGISFRDLNGHLASLIVQQVRDPAATSDGEQPEFSITDLAP
jgi:hypothetical protein